MADTRVNIQVNPHDERIVCGETITFEGFKSEAYDFIKDGKLESFIIDEYIAKKTGFKRVKNGSLNMIVTPGKK